MVDDTRAGFAPVDSFRPGIVMYRLPVVRWDDPNALQTAFVYQGAYDNRKCVFSGLPGEVSVTETDPDTPVWRATVPSASGDTRYYYANAQGGPYRSLIPYSASFDKTDSTYAEHMRVTLPGDAVGGGDVTMRPLLGGIGRPPDGVADRPGDQPGVGGGGRQVTVHVYYDSNGVIDRVERERALHEYTHYDTYVEIHANTTPETKMRCDLDANDKVETVTLNIDWPGLGWVGVWRSSVTWSGDLITQISMAPAGTVTKFTYHSDGTLAAIEDCAGRVWPLRYDWVEE